MVCQKPSQKTNPKNPQTNQKNKLLQEVQSIKCRKKVMKGDLGDKRCSRKERSEMKNLRIIIDVPCARPCPARFLLQPFLLLTGRHSGPALPGSLNQGERPAIRTEFGLFSPKQHLPLRVLTSGNDTLDFRSPMLLTLKSLLLLSLIMFSSCLMKNE